MSQSPALSYIWQHSISLSPWVTFISDLSRFLFDIYCFHSCLLWSLTYCEVSRTGFIIPISETHTLSSVQSLSCVWLFVTPWTAARQASLSITNARSLLKLMSIKLVIPSNHLILCHPLLLPPSIFPSIRVFSNESVLRIRGPKYWSFSFSVSPSKEYSGLISFRMDWLDLLAVQGLSRVFSNTTVQKHQFFCAQLSYRHCNRHLRFLHAQPPSSSSSNISSSPSLRRHLLPHHIWFWWSFDQRILLQLPLPSISLPPSEAERVTTKKSQWDSLSPGNLNQRELSGCWNWGTTHNVWCPDPWSDPVTQTPLSSLTLWTNPFHP